MVRHLLDPKIYWRPSRETFAMGEAFYTSSFPANDTSTTIIFNVFRGEPEALQQQLEAALNQRKVVEYAAITGSALDLQEFIFDHQLGRGNKVADVEQPLDTLVYGEAPRGFNAFVEKLDACSAGATRSSAASPWCKAGRTAAVFRGAKEQDVNGLVAAAERLCAKTNCELRPGKHGRRDPVPNWRLGRDAIVGGHPEQRIAGHVVCAGRGVDVVAGVGWCEAQSPTDLPPHGVVGGGYSPELQD
ncbi:unnamed protein product [Phytophthora lilii]|uniref:Unnamed protein product n=1 Tax=Phytophthora lilii TaxID=2077276 RepID=A0A9W6TDE4_9STRA|nr:unnamed protein product [Phytophthora lilii]